MNTSLEQFDDMPWEALPGADVTDWEAAAAAYELAMLSREDDAAETLPAAVAERIAREAAAFIPRRDGGAIPAGAVVTQQRSSVGRLLMLAGWAVAACLAGVLLWPVWQSRHEAVPRVDVAGPSAVRPGPAELRRRLLAEDPEVVTVAWKAGKDPELAAAVGEATADDLGDIVWSARRQQGFMRIRGLMANDPAVEQYQLWIFDAERNEAHPVDGGVFNVNPGAAHGEVVVAMDPRLPIGKATLFAVTVEKPGGVVVSSRERLPLLASVP